MRPSVLYRIAAVLIAVFAIGHTLGFRQIDPAWGIDPLIHSMQSVHFSAQGSPRTYWEFYVGFGLFVSIFLFLAALLAWQLGSIPSSALASLRVVAWGLAGSFVAVTALSWRYFFVAPVVFSAAIAALLIAATWLSQRSNQQGI